MYLFEELSKIALKKEFKTPDNIKLSQFYHKFQPCRDDREQKYYEHYTKHTGENISKLINTIGKYCLPTIYERLKEKCMVVTGGQLCAYFYGKNWHSDLDIFVTYEYFYNNIFAIVPQILPRDYDIFDCKKRTLFPIDKIGVPEFLSVEDYKTVSILKSYGDDYHTFLVLKYSTDDDRTVDVVVCRPTISPLDAIDNFDLNCCKIFYDGNNVYHYPYLDSGNVEILITPNFPIDMHRKSKYEKRGFTFIVDEIEFKSSFPPNPFTNLVLKLRDNEFHIDVGYFARYSNMIRTMYSGCFSASVEKQHVIDLSDRDWLPIHINDFLKDIYNLETCEVTYDNYWALLEFADYFEIEKLLEKFKVNSKIILDYNIQVKDVVKAYHHDLDIYPNIVIDFVQEIYDMKDFWDIKDEKIRNEIISQALIGSIQGKKPLEISAADKVKKV